MSYSVSTLLTRNLEDVFGENDPARRRAALDESAWPHLKASHGVVVCADELQEPGLAHTTAKAGIIGMTRHWRWKAGSMASASIRFRRE